MAASSRYVPIAPRAYAAILQAHGDTEKAARDYARSRKRGLGEPLRRYRRQHGSGLSAETIRTALGWTEAGDDARVMAAWEEVQRDDNKAASLLMAHTDQGAGVCTSLAVAAPAAAGEAPAQPAPLAEACGRRGEAPAQPAPLAEARGGSVAEDGQVADIGVLAAAAATAATAEAQTPPTPSADQQPETPDDNAVVDAIISDGHGRRKSSQDGRDTSQELIDRAGGVRGGRGDTAQTPDADL
jgi:hypothetical protein